ncbi:MAG: hypothetical protein IKV58_02545, partial [Oscillospiraceae bacterium]|nr:hypothetical protein [Oscillospiraceae bacterium]
KAGHSFGGWDQDIPTTMPARDMTINANWNVHVHTLTFMSNGTVGYGFDAYKEEYLDMIPNGIVDPTKVTRSALQNAASVASMVLTTESLVTDIKEETPAMPQIPAGGGMGF